MSEYCCSKIKVLRYEDEYSRTFSSGPATRIGKLLQLQPSSELRRTFGFSVKTIGLTSEPVGSMGGLKVMPDLPRSAFAPESAYILILPGGESGTNGEVPQVSEAVRTMVSLSRPVAAIWWPAR